MLKVALIGCGAVVERSYLPALKRIEDVNITVFVDPNTSRANRLAISTNSVVVETHNDIPDEVDAVIVTSPNHLHYEIGMDCLEMNKHVLIEKPLALTWKDCNSLISKANSKKLILAVGLVRRFLYSAQITKNFIDKGILGDIEKFEIMEGSIFGWPAVSDYFLRKEAAGGGVLMDTGAHVLDSLIWWLGFPSNFEYADDCRGGVEADCTLKLTMENGITGEVVLSRIRNLTNTATLFGSNATLEVSTISNQVSITPVQSHEGLLGEASIAGAHANTQTTIDLFHAQLSNWIGAIAGEQELVADAQSGAHSIKLIEACYANSTALSESW